MRVAVIHRLGFASIVVGLALGTAVALPGLAGAVQCHGEDDLGSTVPSGCYDLDRAGHAEFDPSSSPSSTRSPEPHGDPTPSSPTPSPATDAPSPGSGSPTPTPQTTSFNPTYSASPTIHATPCEGPVTFGMETTHEVVTAGNAPLLEGFAATVSGSAPNCQSTGGTVTLFERRYGDSAYREIATTETDSEQRFRFAVRPFVQTTYQAWFHGRTSAAATVLIRVHRRIELTATGPTFAGRLTPAEAPIPVGLAFIDAGGRYRFLSQTVADANGSFSMSPRLPRGTYTYVVYTSPRQGLLRGTRSIRFSS